VLTFSSALLLFDVTRAPILLILAAVPCLAAELKPEAVQAYDPYIHDTEARLAAAKPFLWVDASPEPFALSGRARSPRGPGKPMATPSYGPLRGQFRIAARLNLPVLRRPRKSHILACAPCPEVGLLTTTQAVPSSAGREAAEKNGTPLAADNEPQSVRRLGSPA
jgi:hypothetical protein